jgi:uncharacterized ferredoxin-like protein
MTRVSSADSERDGVLTVASLMAVAARTAPKARGVDGVQSLVVEGEDKEMLARAMEEAAVGRPDMRANSLRRDARNLRDSVCAVLIGVTGAPRKPELPLDCGGCGFKNCANMIKARAKMDDSTDFLGPICGFAFMDLGIALGSAARVAAEHNVDNRMMYTIGVGAMRLKWLDVDAVVGIPLSAKGKSIYFDRA